LNNDIPSTSAGTLNSLSAPPPPPLQPTVLYFARLGDMVMLTALLHLLHRRYHKPCQIIGAGSWNSVVYQGNPDVSQVWSFGRHLPFPLSAEWPRVARALRHSDPGPIYICEHHYRQLPRIRRMLAFSGINQARCVFIPDEPGSGEDHQVERLVRLGERTPAALRPTDYPVPSAAPEWAPRLRVLDTDRAERDAWINSQGWSGRQLILVQPGNHRSMSRRRDRWRRLNTDDKAWPTQRWVDLLHKVHARMPNALIVLRGSQEETPMLQGIQAASGLEAVVVACMGLGPLFAFCEAAHSMISVDSGPAHAAAALGLPLVVMFGAGPQRYWLPRSPSSSPVIGVGGPPESMRADQISADTVFDAWCTLLTRMETSPRRQPTNTAAFQSGATFAGTGNAGRLRGGARA
jgi:ADP-heptose:LPS heptosyltransferase